MAGGDRYSTCRWLCLFNSSLFLLLLMAEYTRRKVIYRLGVAPCALQDSWINKNDVRKSGSTGKRTQNDTIYTWSVTKDRNSSQLYFIPDTSIYRTINTTHHLCIKVHLFTAPMFLMYLSYLISVLSVHCDVVPLNTFITARKRNLRVATARQLVGTTEHVI